MMLAEAVAARVEELIEKKGVTQYRVSRLSGVSQSSISELRACKNKTPNLYIVYQIADALQIGLKEFFDSPLFESGNICD